MTFAKLCREADARQRRKPVDAHVARLRKLMADDVSLERAWHELNERPQRAARSTVEALMYSLRNGVGALARPDTVHRLAELSDAQLREVAVRVQKFKPHIAPAWNPKRSRCWSRPGARSMQKTAEQIADELLAKAGFDKSSRKRRYNGPDGGELLPVPSAPMAVARRFVEACCLHDGKVDELTLRYWCGCWWLWQTTHWTEVEQRTVRAMLYGFTEHAVYIDNKGNPAPWLPNRYKIGDLLEALSAIVILPDDFEQPGWIDGRQTGLIVATSNGLLDIATLKLLSHTPLYFSHVSVPFPYDPDAPPPDKWLTFLDELWPDEPDAPEVLGEWFGYVISGRLDLHKIFVMVGPTRGGKGVIARIEAALIGKRNVCGPTLNSLGAEFGLQPMIGKSLAIISDARSGGGKNSISSVTVERLLSISGEDILSVNRKNKVHWIGKLPVRMHIVSNELPRLGDASSAIVGRFVLLLTTRSWLGKEDHELEDKLRAELTGILNWALAGLQRLTFENANHFTRFAAADDAITTMQDLASPVGAFVRERCKLGRDEDGNPYEIAVDGLYAAYKDYAQSCEYPKFDKAQFGRNLRAACTAVRKARPRDGTKRHFVYAGIRLRTDKDDDEEGRFAAKETTDDINPVTVTTMTSDGAGRDAGHGGHSDQLNVAPARSAPTTIVSPDGMPAYSGPVVAVPDLGEDDLDEHGVPKVARPQPSDGGEPAVRHCIHCGEPERPDEPVHEVWVADEGRPFLLHRRCEAEWLRDA